MFKFIRFIKELKIEVSIEITINILCHLCLYIYTNIVSQCQTNLKIVPLVKLNNDALTFLFLPMFQGIFIFIYFFSRPLKVSLENETR